MRQSQNYSDIDQCRERSFSDQKYAKKNDDINIEQVKNLIQQNKNIRIKFRKFQNDAIQSIDEKDKQIMKQTQQLQTLKDYYNNQLEKCYEEIEELCQKNDNRQLNENDELINNLNKQNEDSINVNIDNINQELSKNNFYVQEFIKKIQIEQQEMFDKRYNELLEQFKTMSENLDESSNQEIQNYKQQCLEQKQQIQNLQQKYNLDMQVQQQEFDQQIKQKDMIYNQTILKLQNKIQQFEQKEIKNQQFLDQQNQQFEQKIKNLEQQNINYQKNENINQQQFQAQYNLIKQLKLQMLEKENIIQLAIQDNEKLQNDIQILSSEFEKFKNTNKRMSKRASCQQIVDFQRLSASNFLLGINQNIQVFSKSFKIIILLFNQIYSDQAIYTSQNFFYPKLSINKTINELNSTTLQDSIKFESKASNEYDQKTSLNDNQGIDISNLNPYVSKLVIQNENDYKQFGKIEIKEIESIIQNKKSQIQNKNVNQSDKIKFFEKIDNQFEQLETQQNEIKKMYFDKDENFNIQFQKLQDRMESFYLQLFQQYQLVTNEILMKTISKFEPTVFKKMQEKNFIDLQITGQTSKLNIIFYQFLIKDQLTNKEWSFECRYSEIFKFYEKIKNKTQIKFPSKFEIKTDENLQNRLTQLKTFFFQLLQQIEKIESHHLREFIFIQISKSINKPPIKFQLYQKFEYDQGFINNAQQFSIYFEIIKNIISYIKEDTEILEKNEMLSIIDQ